MARSRSSGERPLDWVGLSKTDFLSFPEAVKDEMGNALGVAQFGGKHPSAKPWKGRGSGVLEVVEDHNGDTYRAVYTVRLKEVVYVLHAFQKKSSTGINTAQLDVDMVERRLKIAQQDYEAHYGKPRRWGAARGGWRDCSWHGKCVRRSRLFQRRGAADQAAPSVRDQ
jgi:phage-related protein